MGGGGGGGGFQGTEGGQANANVDAGQQGNGGQANANVHAGQQGNGGQANANVHAGRQGKHIVGHNNYTLGKSILNGSVEEAQELISQYAGTGQQLSNGRERVDFGRIIGKWYDKDTGTYFDTTMGIIHYSKHGAHIVPSTPK